MATKPTEANKAALDAVEEALAIDFADNASGSTGDRTQAKTAGKPGGDVAMPRADDFLDDLMATEEQAAPPATEEPTARQRADDARLRERRPPANDDRRR